MGGRGLRERRRTRYQLTHDIVEIAETHPSPRGGVMRIYLYLYSTDLFGKIVRDGGEEDSQQDKSTKRGKNSNLCRSTAPVF